MLVQIQNLNPAAKQEIPVKKQVSAGQPLQVKVQPGMRLEISVDGVKQSGKAQSPDAQSLKLKRAGAHLHLVNDQGETVCELLGFFDTPDATLAGVDWTLVGGTAQELAEAQFTDMGFSSGAADVALAPAAAAPGLLGGAAGGAGVSGGLGGVGAGLGAAAGVAAAAGGGGGGGGGSPNVVAVNSIIRGKVTLGDVVAGHDLVVEVYTLAADATGKLTTTRVESDTKINSDGSYEINLGSYTGAIRLRVFSRGDKNDYLDEATNQNVNLSSTIEALAVVTGSAITVNVTPLTHLASLKNTQPTVDNIVAINQAVGQAFGIDDIIGTRVVTTTSDAFATTADDSAGKKYGAVLAALSGMEVQADGTTASTQQTLEKLASSITLVSGSPASGSAISASLSNTAKAQVVEGANVAGQASAALKDVISALVKTTVRADDAAIVTEPAALALQDTPAVDSFATASGVLSAKDVKSSALTFGLGGATSGGGDVFNAITYDLKKIGTYGTLYLVSKGEHKGQYIYVPNAEAINAVSSNQAERFVVSASDGILSGTNILRVNVAGSNDAPTLTLTTPVTLGYANDGTWVELFSGAGVSPVDAGQTIKGLVFTVGGIDGTASEKIRVDGDAISLARAGTSGTTSASGIGYTVTVRGSTATIVLKSAQGLSADAAQSLVDAISYAYSSTNGMKGDRTVTLTEITDSGGDHNTSALNGVRTVRDPNAPTRISVIDNAGLGRGQLNDDVNTTDDNTPTLRYWLGASGAVAGDQVQFYNGNTAIGSAQELTQDDIDAGYVDLTLPALYSGSYSFNAVLIDAAGEVSQTGANKDLTIVISANQRLQGMSGDQPETGWNYELRSSDHSIAALSDGGYVVVWNGFTGAQGHDVFVQRYNEANAPVGDMLRVQSPVDMVDDIRLQVAALADGQYVLTWTSGAGTPNDDADIYVQRYGADNLPIGGVHTLQGQQGASDYLPQVTALDGGGYVLVWRTSTTDQGLDVFVQAFDANGSASGAQHRLASATGQDEGIPALTALSDGGYVVSWLGTTQSDGHEVFVQRYNAQSQAVGGMEHRSGDVGTAFNFLPASCAWGNGGYVLAWAGSNGDQGTDVYVQRFNSANEAVDTLPQRLQGKPGPFGVYRTHLTALSDGGFVLSWTEQVAEDDGNDHDVFIQRFDEQGTKGSYEQHQLQGVAGAWDDAVKVLALPSGGYVVAWCDRDTCLQLFNAQDQAIGGVARLQGAESHFVRNLGTPQLAALPDGGFVVSFEDYTDDGQSSDIFAQRFDANGLPWVDSAGPVVQDIAISGAMDAQEKPIEVGDGVVLKAGDVIIVTARFDEAVSVAGTPQLALKIGDGTVLANYSSGSGSRWISFSHTLLGGQADSDGISINANSLSPNDGYFRDMSGNDGALTHEPVSDNAHFLVDFTPPALQVTQTNDTIGLDGVINATELDEGLVFSGTTEAGLSVTLSTGIGTEVTVTSDAETGEWIATLFKDDLPVSGDVTFTITSSDAANNTATEIRTALVDASVAPPVLSQRVALIELFDSNANAWTGNAIVSGGRANATDASTILSKAISLTAGATYALSFDYVKTGGMNIRVANNHEDIDHFEPQTLEDSGNYTITFVAQRDGITIAADGDVFTGSIDNLLLYEVASNMLGPSPQIKGVAEAGATVTLYNRGRVTALGTAVADDHGVWIFNATILTRGSHSITATQTDLAGNVSALSAPYEFSIVVRPRLLDPSPQDLAQDDTRATIPDGQHIWVANLGFDFSTLVQLDLRADPAANALHLSTSDVLALANHILVVQGDASDSVNLQGEGWVCSDTPVVAGEQSYLLWSNGSAQVLIDQDLATSGRVL